MKSRAFVGHDDETLNSKCEIDQGMVRNNERENDVLREFEADFLHLPFLSSLSLSISASLSKTESIVDYRLNTSTSMPNNRHPKRSFPMYLSIHHHSGCQSNDG